MNIVETYVKNLSRFSLYMLEDFMETWLEAKDGEIKQMIMPALINEKLIRYEQEY